VECTPLSVEGILSIIVLLFLALGLSIALHGAVVFIRRLPTEAEGLCCYWCWRYWLLDWCWRYWLLDWCWLLDCWLLDCWLLDCWLLDCWCLLGKKGRNDLSLRRHLVTKVQIVLDLLHVLGVVHLAHLSPLQAGAVHGISLDWAAWGAQRDVKRRNSRHWILMGDG
jgi:hypothetical protein